MVAGAPVQGLPCARRRRTRPTPDSLSAAAAAPADAPGRQGTAPRHLPCLLRQRRVPGVQAYAADILTIQSCPMPYQASPMSEGPPPGRMVCRIRHDFGRWCVAGVRSRPVWWGRRRVRVQMPRQAVCVVAVRRGRQGSRAAAARRGEDVCCAVRWRHARRQLQAGVHSGRAT